MPHKDTQMCIKDYNDLEINLQECNDIYNKNSNFGVCALSTFVFQQRLFLLEMRIRSLEDAEGCRALDT